jgi:hypothetical protein
VGGSFTIPDIGNLSRTGGAVLITGTLNSSSNSTLDLDTTTGAWKLQGGRINGITVNATPPAFLGIAGIATLDGVTLNSDVVFDNFSTAVVLDSLRLNGAPSGIGTFSMTGSNDNLQQDVGTLTFTSGITAFSNGTSQIGNPSLPLINQGTITASSAAGSISVLGSTVTNSGAIRLLLGAQATVSNCSNYANNTLSGGIWFVAGSGTLRIPGADIVTNAANITLDGANANIFADNGTLNALRNFATNTGTFTIQSGRTFAIASLTNSGQLTASSGGVISITGTLTNSGTVTVGSGGTITTTTSITGTLTNSGTVSIGAFGALTAGTITGSGIIKNDGTLLFSSATDSDQTYVRGAGTTNLASARLTLTNVQQTRLTLTNSAAMTLTSRSNGGTLSTIKTLSIDANSKLDLKDTDLAIDYSGTTPRTTIRGYLLSGYSSSSWSGPQLTSSTAQAIASDGQQVHKTALGYGEASVLKLTSFDGQAIDSTTLLIAYTLYGDASLDRVVNALDFNSLATNFGGTSGKAWTEGDFNYDGITNTLDFNALASNFNLALPAPALGSLIPEPAVALAIFAVFVLTPRRRR